MANPQSQEVVENRTAKSADTRKVRRYLEALEAGYGRPLDVSGLQHRLEAVQDELVAANAVQRVKLIQERLDLEESIAAAGTDWGFTELEAEAVEVMARWAEERGFSYQALREAGVPASVMRRAGISRARR